MNDGDGTNGLTCIPRHEGNWLWKSIPGATAARTAVIIQLLTLRVLIIDKSQNHLVISYSIRGKYNIAYVVTPVMIVVREIFNKWISFYFVSSVRYLTVSNQILQVKFDPLPNYRLSQNLACMCTLDDMELVWLWNRKVAIGAPS